MIFFGRKKDVTVPTKIKPPLVVKLTGRNYSEYSSNDVALKFWLPLSAEKKIDELCTYFDTCASDFIRQILFIHLYGRYDLIGLIERQDNRFDLAEKKHDRFSRPPQSDVPTVPDAPPKEKNIADVKVWLPSKMKADLKGLAERRQMKLSRYARLVILNHLFGNLPFESGIASLEPPAGMEEEQ